MPRRDRAVGACVVLPLLISYTIWNARPALPSSAPVSVIGQAHAPQVGPVTRFGVVAKLAAPLEHQAFALTVRIVKQDGDVPLVTTVDGDATTAHAAD